MSEKQVKPQPIKAKIADSEARAWHDFQLENIQKTPERQENAAKFLAGMISISLTIFLKVSSVDKLPSTNQYLEISIIIIWLLSLMLAFFVLFPFNYKYVPKSSASIKDVHYRIIRTKNRFLIVSVVCFLAALILLSIKEF